MSALLFAATVGLAAPDPATAATSAGVTLNVTCGATASATLTVTNTGSSSLTVTGVDVTGAPDDAFAPVTGGLVLAPGASAAGTLTGPTAVEVVVTVVGDGGPTTFARTASCPETTTTAPATTPPTVPASSSSTQVLPSPTIPSTTPDTTAVSPGPVLPTVPGATIAPAPGGSAPASSAPATRPPATRPSGTGPGTTEAPASTSTTGGPPASGDGSATRPFDFRFQPAGTMAVGGTYRISVLVTPPGVEPTRSLPTFDASASTVVQERRVGCLVRGRLSTRPGDFDVLGGDDIETELCEGETTRDFTWSVIPLRAGPLPVEVVFNYGPEFRRTEKVVAEIVVTGVPSSTSGPAPPSTSAPVGPATAGGSDATWWGVGAALLALGTAGAAVGLRRRRRVPVLVTAAATPGGPDGRPVVFLSYSRHDRDAVAEIHAELEAHGYDVWRDVDDIAAGDAWRHAIVEGLRRSVAVLFVVSSNSAGSMQVAREIALADEERKPIIPIVLPGEAELPGSLRYTLAGTQVVDLRVLSREEGVARVRAALAAIVARTAAVRPSTPSTPLPPPAAGAAADLAPPAGANPSGDAGVRPLA